MKTEKEIRDRLELSLEAMKEIKQTFHRMFGSGYDNHIGDVCGDLVEVEAEIKALRWVLGEAN